ncbi:MAG: dephospho-CoA kinase [Parachlamydia sp.]|jgi:dephospho-CoA kinase|nr:dephospho-CoA kinase [Parachlamydia sp.]
MLKLKKVAITGGLSCGKSSVCRLLKELGAYVLSADEIVHQLLSTDDKIIRQVVQLLGPDILVEEQIDRFLVAEIVFRDLEKMKELEQILHPAVYEEIKHSHLAQQNANQPPALFVAEVPLLFESNGEKYFDATAVILAEDKTCLERFISSQPSNREEFERRMSNQFKPLEKALRADYVIMNNDTLIALNEPVKQLFAELTEDNGMENVQI